MQWTEVAFKPWPSSERFARNHSIAVRHGLAMWCEEYDQTIAVKWSSRQRIAYCNAGTAGAGAGADANVGCRVQAAEIKSKSVRLACRWVSQLEFARCKA